MKNLGLWAGHGPPPKPMSSSPSIYSQPLRASIIVKSFRWILQFKSGF